MFLVTEILWGPWKYSFTCESELILTPMNIKSHVHGHSINKSGTDSFHRTGAASSRTGLTDRWGSPVPPDHNPGHTGRWSEPLAPARRGTSSSSRSGSRAGLDRSRFGTPLRGKKKNTNKTKRWLMAPLWRRYCSWSRFSCSEESRNKQDKQHRVWFWCDTGSRSLWRGIQLRLEDWWTYCAITWPWDRMMDFICAGQSSNTTSSLFSLWTRTPFSFNSVQFPLNQFSIKSSQAVSYPSQLCLSATGKRLGFIMCCHSDFFFL